MLLVALPAMGFAAANGYGQQGRGLVDISGLPLEEISAGERAGLLLMREEEKLARDVYLALHERWNLPIFANIAKSEQQHMDAVATLLKRYGIPDPVSGEQTQHGVYADPQLQQLYDDLVARGGQSLTAALDVGATIEDLDIKDLYELLEQTDNRDIELVYQNLAKGSRNHLRSFTGQLSRQGASYEAKYLSQAQIDQIISGQQERGPAQAF
jgi:hypothetical protein